MTIHTTSDKPVKPLVHEMANVTRWFPPTMSTLCECGMRYGTHRVGDLACMNQQWIPGNWQPQWLERNWKRA